MNRQMFPNINKFRKRCMNYSYYFSTATSTAMTMSDITYGDFYRIENTERFGEFKVTHKKAQSFVDRLTDEGYHSMGVHYPTAIGDDINPGHMYAQKTDLMNYANYDKAIEDVKKTIDGAVESDSPFLIYFCNEVSHICYADYRKNQIKDPTERWRYGYKKVDDTVGDIVGYLEEKQLLDDTVVVLYGDHGDDYYCHDYNGGYVHVIEPYINLIHTPLMIYDKSLGSGKVDDIICALDIKQVIYNLIGEKTVETNPYIYDRYRSKRKYVFSKNLYAGQVPKKIDACISNVRKSYAITTKQYSLILTDQGYRMYLNVKDPTCNSNVLDFFYMLGNKVYHIMDIKYLHNHYKNYIGFGSIEVIQQNFTKLSKLMKMEMTKLEDETGIKGIIDYRGYHKIFYTKNMFYMFFKLRAKGVRRKIKNLLPQNPQKDK